MKYKVKVLRRFPEARPVVLRTSPIGEVRYVAIFNGDIALDIHDGCLGQQNHTAAWRSAYFWCQRNPVEGAA
jgi:hypothetical protein